MFIKLGPFFRLCTVCKTCIKTHCVGAHRRGRAHRLTLRAERGE